MSHSSDACIDKQNSEPPTQPTEALQKLIGHVKELADDALSAGVPPDHIRLIFSEMRDAVEQTLWAWEREQGLSAPPIATDRAMQGIHMLKSLIPALHIPPLTKRVIIDIPHDGMVTVHHTAFVGAKGIQAIAAVASSAKIVEHGGDNVVTGPLF
jgi:hypothetical protein